MIIDIHGHLGNINFAKFWQADAPTLERYCDESNTDLLCLSSSRSIMYDVREGNAELDAALAQFRELAGEAERMDKAELYAHRQILRKPNTQDARDKLQQAHGKQYSPITMMEVQQDVDHLLREDERKLEPLVQKQPVRHQPEPRKKQPKRDYER